MSDPLGVFQIGIFNTQVAVFDSLKKLQKHHTKTLGHDPIDGLNPASYGMCIKETVEDGTVFFYLYIGKDANRYTRIHECSHLVDWVMNEVGVPVDVHNTEIRAYMLAECCQLLDEVLQEHLERENG